MWLISHNYNKVNDTISSMVQDEIRCSTFGGLGCVIKSYILAEKERKFDAKNI